MSTFEESFDRAMAAAGGTDRTSNETVVEYGVQEMINKGKSPKAAAASTAKKLSGTENIFLGPGVSFINPAALEGLLWARLADFVVRGIPKVKPGFEHYVLDGTLQHFRQKPEIRAKLKQKVIATMGRNPFTGEP